MTNRGHLQSLMQKQGSLILAVDGLKPDVGNEVFWVVRDCVSGEILLARPLVRSREAELVTLLKEVQDTFSIPIRGVMRRWAKVNSECSSNRISRYSSSVVSLSLVSAKRRNQSTRRIVMLRKN